MVNKFPIILSQDCNHAETAQMIQKFSYNLFASLKVILNLKLKFLDFNI